MKQKTILTVAVLTIFLASIITLSGCGESTQVGDPDPKPDGETNAVVELTLYFSDDQAQFLVAEQRDVEVEDKEDTSLVASKVVEELINGPEQQDLFQTIPDETKLLGVEIEQNIAYVNFSQEFVTNHWGGTAGEAMTLYSIINSLTELSEIEKVQILVEDEVLETLGHSDLTEPLTRSEDIIK
ncbi:hypothetical protein SYNTR_0209 [Candidatus Syntrophocurvum alkaliphilum]|uniref:GerMN domain-containing protein n=1 Tax=Candidatus Syntrophocurvum alkaliphilum TaxID=2293317 RepID=A0A6I6DD95_9FIRM|nr:GerMN domain-containing protein [Candidatus Syntrophocurvum alkaliphilum]QGT98802.1 hypothetical protein SYNTR_0209 [Candidatus Syntrophocurvum alkaliphilum]